MFHAGSHLNEAGDGPSEEAPSRIPDVTQTREVIQKYTYELYGKLQPDKGLLVTGSKWIEDGLYNSVFTHPDFVILLPEDVRTAPRETALNPNFDPAIVDQLLKESRPL